MDRTLNVSATANEQQSQAPPSPPHDVWCLRSNQAPGPFVSSRHSYFFLSLMNEIDYRTELNNFLQANGGTGRLQWQISPHGPQHELIWTAICCSGCFLIQQHCSRLILSPKLMKSSMARPPVPPWQMRRTGLPIWHTERSCSNVSVKLREWWLRRYETRVPIGWFLLNISPSQSVTVSYSPQCYDLLVPMCLCVRCVRVTTTPCSSASFHPPAIVMTPITRNGRST